MDETAAQESGLEGGEIDDNDDLDAFIAYVEGERELYGDDPSLEWLDVSGRQLITVTDSYGVTVPDARLTFWSEEGRILQFGRTRADGRFAFFPNIFDAAGVIEVEAESAYGYSQTVSLDSESSELSLQINGERPPVQEINLEVAFIIDATGSMGGEISRLKDTVTNIAERVGQDGVRLRLGAVAYRDRGDEYTTQTYNFTEDIAAFQEVIDGLEADGGGDYPEALNEALEEAQRRLSWTQDESLRLTFLITDAPANYYDKQDFTYAQGVLDAQQMGMKIFPIASGGSDGVAEVQLRQIAQHTLAHFIFITEGGGSTSGSEGSDYHVDPAQFDVERLDDLVVRLINEEVEAWRFEVPEAPL
jgi:Mg-chelatase subunit ChlD